MQITAAPGKNNVITIHGILFEDGTGTIHVYEDGDSLTGELANKDIQIPQDANVWRVAVWAGDGNDRVYNFTELRPVLHGGPGNDYLYSGGTADWMAGEDGDDRLDSRSNNDRLWGGPGSDVIEGGYGDDEIYGSDGNPNSPDESDTFFGGPGDDLMFGGLGGDVLDGGSESDQAYGQAGNDTCPNSEVKDSCD
ncbi:hypothetical protein [Streptomyces sp. NPDC026092]|uniref:calcium-binding protein n=1 Tax=Streptomyces sp. NPDC026092 TaxID=3154797 RepID=UPI0033EB1A5B